MLLITYRKGVKTLLQEPNCVGKSAYQIEPSESLYHKPDGNGYYRPEKEDIPAVRGWLKQETARAKSIFWSIKGARKFLKGEGNGK